MPSLLMMPLGTASVGSGMSGRTFFDAAHVAEAAGEAQRAGRKRRCSRDSKTVVSPEECLAKFRAGLRPCVTLFAEMGRCHTGVIEDAKHPEETMARGICRNPECPNAGERVRYAARGFCSKCYPKVLKGMIPDPDKHGMAAPSDPLEMREVPDSGRDETPAVAAVQGGEAAISGQAEPFEKIEELPAQEQPHVSAILDREEVAALDEAVGQDHIEADLTMVPDLPEDLDRPFSLGGFDFEPAPPRRVFGSRLAAIKSKSLSIRTGAIREHGLDRYGFARIAVSVDGKALAIKFYAEHRPDACKVQCKRKSSALIAMESLTKAHPEWIGREAALEWMGVEGWFLMRVGGEAA